LLQKLTEGDDEYTTFITPEAYLSLESWINYRSACGEQITKDSWVMRDLWNAAKLPKKDEKGKIQSQSNHNLYELDG
jgi:hypothetical protein